MHQFETTVAIDAAPQDVWAALVDVENWPQWTASVQAVRWVDGAVVDGAVPAVGSRARVKQPGMPALTWAVTELDAGRSFHWQTSSPGVRTLGTHTIATAGDGRSTLTLGLRQSGPLAGLVNALAGARTRRYVQMEADGLKRAAEARRVGTR